VPRSLRSVRVIHVDLGIIESDHTIPISMITSRLRAEGVKKRFCRFQVGGLEPFAEPMILIQQFQHGDTENTEKNQRVG
jgi:hypothetical protein